MFADITLAQALGAIAVGFLAPFVLFAVEYLLTYKTNGDDYDEYW